MKRLIHKQAILAKLQANQAYDESVLIPAWQLTRTSFFLLSKFSHSRLRALSHYHETTWVAPTQSPSYGPENKNWTQYGRGMSWSRGSLVLQKSIRPGRPRYRGSRVVAGVPCMERQQWIVQVDITTAELVDQRHQGPAASHVSGCPGLCPSHPQARKRPPACSDSKMLVGPLPDQFPQRGQELLVAVACCHIRVAVAPLPRVGARKGRFEGFFSSLRWRQTSLLEVQPSAQSTPWRCH